MDGIGIRADNPVGQLHRPWSSRCPRYEVGCVDRRRGEHDDDHQRPHRVVHQEYLDLCPEEPQRFSLCDPPGSGSSYLGCTTPVEGADGPPTMAARLQRLPDCFEVAVNRRASSRSWLHEVRQWEQRAGGGWQVDQKIGRPRRADRIGGVPAPSGGSRAWRLCAPGP